MKAFIVFGRACKFIWEDMLLLILMNMLTLLFCVLIIPGPAAWAALCHMCNKVANQYAISWDEYWAVFRREWRPWAPMTAIATIISALIMINFFFYSIAFPGQTWVPYVQGAWLAGGLLWLAVQFYLYPMFVEQEKKSWRMAIRNAAVIAGANPLFTFLLLLIGGTLIGVSLFLVPPLFVLLGPAFWLMLGNAATIDRLEIYRKRMDQVQPKS